jgi:MSHA biogenesis protein MshN
MGLGLSLEADGRLPEARDAYQRARATGALTPELSEFVDQKLKRLQ